MNSQNFALISMTLEGKLNKQDKFLALQRCENLDDSSISLLSTINFKSPLTGLLLHWLLGIFGGGRFYKGDIVHGVLYIVAFVIIFILFYAGAVVDEEDGDEGLLGVSVILFLIYYIVLLVDFYFIYKGIQKDNWQKLATLLLSQNSCVENANFTQTAKPNTKPERADFVADNFAKTNQNQAKLTPNTQQMPFYQTNSSSNLACDCHLCYRGGYNHRHSLLPAKRPCRAGFGRV